MTMTRYCTLRTAVEARRANLGGEPLRSIARRDGVHASTVLRRCQRAEAQTAHPLGKEMFVQRNEIAAMEATAQLALRRLTETGAEMVCPIEGGGVCLIVKPGDDGAPAVIGKVSASRAAELFELRWIRSTRSSERVARYEIAPSGRRELSRILREKYGRRSPEGPMERLARIKDPLGRSWLRLPHFQAAWRIHGLYQERGEAAVREALAALDEVARDLVIEVVCRETGLERAERRLGLSPRSGKVVLRIALAALEGGAKGAGAMAMNADSRHQSTLRLVCKAL